MRETYVEQVRAMCRLLYPAHINIDYFPTNFVVQGGTLYYIDFECNEYMEQWDFEHWWIKYWSKTSEFMRYVNDHQLDKFQFIGQILKVRDRKLRSTCYDRKRKNAGGAAV